MHKVYVVIQSGKEIAFIMYVCLLPLTDRDNWQTFM